MTALLIALSLLTPTQADTAPPNEAEFRALVDEGLEAYQARRYDEAAQVFLQAHAIIPEPELVYNAGRAYEKGLELEAAIEQYERFLTLEGTTARLRSKALESLKALRAELEAKNNPDGVAPQPVVMAVPPPRGPDRALEISLLATGGAALATGGVFGILALQSKSEFDDAGPGDDREDLREEVNRNAVAADILIASGAALAATGIILFFVRKGPDRRNQASFTPTVGPGSIGLAGTF